MPKLPGDPKHRGQRRPPTKAKLLTGLASLDAEGRHILTSGLKSEHSRTDGVWNLGRETTHRPSPRLQRAKEQEESLLGPISFDLVSAVVRTLGEVRPPPPTYWISF